LFILEKHREHGYEKVEDHIRDCNLEETEKIKEIIALEKQRLNKLKMMNNSVEDRNSQSSTTQDEVLSQDLADENHLERTRLKMDEISEPEEDEEDEEMAMAREEENQMEEDDSYVFDTTQDIQDVVNDNNEDNCAPANNYHTVEFGMTDRDEVEDEASDTTPAENRETVENPSIQNSATAQTVAQRE
jgi:hypothetical protein